MGGLHILEKESLLDKNNVKDRIVEYILSLQLKNGGFTSSTLYSQFNGKSKYGQGHIVFTYSALNCLHILGAIDKIDKKIVLE